MFDQKGKLIPQYVGPFENLEDAGRFGRDNINHLTPIRRILYVYKFPLPMRLSIFPLVFYDSMLKRYHGDGDDIIKWDSNLFYKDLAYEEEPVMILDRDVQKLSTKEICLVKVQQQNHLVQEGTWEIKKDMLDKYPQFFEDTCTLFSPYISLFFIFDFSGMNNG